jgi:antitoxin HigA-1
MPTTATAPPHPGAVLRERVLPALGLSVAAAARELGVTRQTLHRILAADAGVTPEMAVRLGRLCGTGPASWLRLQRGHDLWRAERALGAAVEAIPRHDLPPNVARHLLDARETP